jgi:hypothetical protein
VTAVATAATAAEQQVQVTLVQVQAAVQVDMQVAVESEQPDHPVQQLRVQEAVAEAADLVQEVLKHLVVVVVLDF